MSSILDEDQPYDVNNDHHIHIEHDHAVSTYDVGDSSFGGTSEVGRQRIRLRVDGIGCSNPYAAAHLAAGEAEHIANASCGDRGSGLAEYVRAMKTVGKCERVGITQLDQPELHRVKCARRKQD